MSDWTDFDEIELETLPVCDVISVLGGGFKCFGQIFAFQTPAKFGQSRCNRFMFQGCDPKIQSDMVELDTLLV